MKKALTFILAILMFNMLTACGRAGAPKPIPYDSKPHNAQTNQQP